ncbi:class I SAM-dependent methyltransferase [Sphingobium sp. AP49]|uniref:class I SAM-dependent methyltransferase n=1 Tax=Sphingobium sp. AP49 TaxID=1144307 RepID=UPI00026EE71C|nr:class I SAM-dependent methyltransferase [Sphingobium sp. AP49]WHO37586.1 class I SAM-dependent methyltransferase [Sphingobium sp. AP49]
MAEAEFDAVANDYVDQHARSIQISGESPDFFADYKIADLRRMADRLGWSPRRILDFGAGIGNSLAPLRRYFPDAAITCLDVSDQSLDICRSKASGDTRFLCYDGERLPDDLGQFDLIFTACVFHHIPETQHVDLLRQIRQALAPDGMFVLFEHNPWNPLTQRAVRACPFDRNAVLISAPEMRARFRAAGFDQIDRRYRIFFPRALAALRPLEPLLTGVPLGAQYSLAGRAA